VVALLCALVGLPSAASAVPEPVKILVVGDSVAQGSAGDWTWRYRLWQSLEESGVEVDFVGPRDDLFDNVSEQLGSQAYADPGFDRDHAARWGMAMDEPDVSMGDLVEEYHPDVVVEARGVNDLLYRLGAAELTEVLADEIEEARAVDPDVDFVVGQLPQTWLNHVVAYNAGLPDAAASLSDDDSRVVVAATGSGFAQGVDTWDPAHLAATGEVKMAAGVADALAALGVGDGAGTAPAVVNGHWGEAVLEAEPGVRSAQLSWAAPPGAREEYVWTRDATAGEDWSRLPFPLTGTSWDAGGLVPGHVHEFRLQSAKGTAVSPGYSNVVGVVPTSGPVSPPHAPASVAVTPGDNQLTVTWAAVPTASSYDVTWTSDLPGGSGMTSAASGPLVLPGLMAGREYTVSVVARNDGGSSAPVVARGTPTGSAVTGPHSPGRPGRVVVSPGSHRLGVTWAPVAGATAYDVTWGGRRLGMRGSAVVTSPAARITHVLAGERYDVTVTARNAVGSGPAAKAVGVPRGPKVPAPARLRAEQIAAHRALLTWRHRAAATSYSVEIRRHGRWEPVRTVVATALVVRRLPRGVAGFRVRPWHQLVAGRWSREVRVRIGA
jgi:hypothetical protein